MATLTAAPQPIDIKIYSDDEKQLLKIGPRVARAISSVPGVVEIKDGVVYAGDALEIKVDRVKAALEGVDPEAVTKQMQDAISGGVTTHIQEGPKMVGVRLWMPDEIRQTEWNIRHLMLQAPDGHLFRLKRVADVKILTGEPQIMRENLQRMIAVTARISGRSMGGAIADIKKILDRKGLFPANVTYELGGLYQQQQIAFAGLFKVFLTAVLLVFSLLLFIYESFRMAFAILATTLLSTAAVFIGLWLTGIELNITSMMGMTMIIGIVTEVGIFFASEYHDLPPGEMPARLLIAAGVNRMRPIMMTTLAAILALFPLALGIGQGAAMQQPLAVAIISGLAAQFPLVLIVLPAFLVLLRHRRKSGKG